MSQQMSDPRNEMASSQRARRGRQLSSTQVMFAVILAIGLILAIQFSTRINAERELVTIQNTIEEEINLLRREQSDLTDQLSYVGSDAYVEAWARGEGRMVREGEVLVIPVPSESTLLAQQTAPVEIETAAVETTLPQPDSWELWWALFFDAPPPVLNPES